MITVGEIYSLLCELFPLESACDFDNVGLLVGDPETDVSSALIALDCDINTVKKARESGCRLIITHHPVIFDGLKSVLSGGVVYECVKAGISVISMHTNLDIANGGVNDALCEVLGLENIAHYTAADGFLLRCGEIKEASADDFAKHIKKVLGTAVTYSAADRTIKKVLVCSGAGSSFLGDAVSGGFDALVTADVKHNVFIDAVNSGISVFDAGHYATENIIVKRLCEILSESFKDVCFSEYNSQNIKYL